MVRDSWRFCARAAAHDHGERVGLCHELTRPCMRCLLRLACGCRAESVMAAVQDEVAAGDVRFVLHVGDISYGDGRGEVWQAFMHDITPVASRVPYMVAVGNHDYDYDHGKRRRDPSGADRLPKWAREDASNGECGVALATRFQMPQRGCVPRRDVRAPLLRPSRVGFVGRRTCGVMCSRRCCGLLM